MSSPGAPIGNKNASKGKPWRDAILRAIEIREKSRVDGKKELDALAEKLLDLVSAGDLPALKEFGDRMDGKPAQAIIGGGDDDPALKVSVLERVLVRPDTSNTDR